MGPLRQNPPPPLPKDTKTQVPVDMNEPTFAVTTAIGVLTALYLATLWVKAIRSPIRSIPTVGHAGIFTSYITAFRFFFHARELIQEGYEKHRGSAFKVATVSRWAVVVTGIQMVDDIRKATDEQMSFREAVAETIQTDYMIGPQIRLDPYHVGIVRTPLTRNLAVRFPDIRDEITAAFSELIPAKENEWLSLPAYETIVQTVVRTSNRLFVGLPLCRDPDFKALNVQFTFDVIKGSKIINLFPPILKPLVGRFFTNVPKRISATMGYLRPIIEERLAKIEQFGSDYPDKPNDLISWLLDTAEGHRRTLRDLSIRVLSINFAAIHTTSMAFTHVLYDLAMHPECVKSLREEVESVISQEGWTKASMGKMRKVDSFIKESQRMAGIAALLMTRKTTKDFTFSNGLVVPTDTFVSVPSYAVHHDEDIYPNSHHFDAFRFSKMRDGDDGESIKHQMVSLALDYITFGNGRHACPGRFFAVNELKAMLAYILLNYDVKMPEEGPRPADFWFGQNIMPNRHAHVMFRKRSV